MPSFFGISKSRAPPATAPFQILTENEAVAKQAIHCLDWIIVITTILASNPTAIAAGPIGVGCEIALTQHMITLKKLTKRAQRIDNELQLTVDTDGPLRGSLRMSSRKLVIKSARRASQSQSNFLRLRKGATKADELVDNALAAVFTAHEAKAFLVAFLQGDEGGKDSSAVTLLRSVLHYCEQVYGAARDVRDIFNKESKAFAKGDLRPADRTAAAIAAVKDAQDLRRSINNIGPGAQEIYVKITTSTSDTFKHTKLGIPDALTRLSDNGIALATLPYHLYLSEVGARLLQAEKAALERLQKLTFPKLKADASNNVKISQLGRSFDAERLFKYVRMKEGGHKTAGQFNSKDVLQLIRWNNQDTKTHAALSSSAAAAATHFLTVGTAMDVALLHDKSRKPLEKILRRDTDFDSEEEVRDTFGQINEIFHGNDHKSGLVNHFNNILDFEAQNGDYIAVWFGEDSERAGNQYSHVNICTLTGRWKIMTGTGNTNTITLKPMIGDSTEGRATPVDEIYIAQFKMGAECYVNGMGYGIVADTVGCTSEEWEDRAFCVPVLIDGANDPAEYHIQGISIRISTTESDDQ